MTHAFSPSPHARRAEDVLAELQAEAEEQELIEREAGRILAPKGLPPEEINKVAIANAHLALNTLTAIAADPKAPAPSRIAASKEIKEWGLGRAAGADTQVNVQVNNNIIVEYV